MTGILEIVLPTRDKLDQYVAALQRGWQPVNDRPLAVQEQFDAIARDAEGFVARQFDPEAKGPPVTMPDGTQVPRLPGYVYWIWDGEFCGNIGLRWQHGRADLPPYVLGHIGYTVVPWKQRRGYATAALKLMLEKARAEGLPYVEITTDPANLASQKVIEANGGMLVERFIKSAHHGGKPGLRFRIEL